MDLDPEVARYLERVAQSLPVPAVVDAEARRARMEAIQRRFPPTPDTVAREAGAVTATLDPLEALTPSEEDAGADYFRVMRENLAALRKALGCH